MIGTPNYVAPEVILGAKHGHEVDWWAVGIIMYECLVGCPPFVSDDMIELFSLILKGEIDWTPMEENGVSPLAVDLIAKLLHQTPKERLGHLGASQVKNHPYFSDIDWDTLLTEKALFIPKLADPTDTSYFGEVQVKSLSIEELPDTTSQMTRSVSNSSIDADSSSEEMGRESDASSAQTWTPSQRRSLADYPSSSFDTFDFVNYQALSALDRQELRGKPSRSKKKDRKDPVVQLRERTGRERSLSNPERIPISEPIPIEDAPPPAAVASVSEETLLGRNRAQTEDVLSKSSDSTFKNPFDHPM